jgi:hypothetical protein
MYRKDIKALRLALKDKEISKAQFDYLINETNGITIVLVLHKIKQARAEAPNTTKEEGEYRDSQKLIEDLLKSENTPTAGN